MNNKNHPEGEKHAGRQAEDWSTVKHLTHMRHTKDIWWPAWAHQQDRDIVSQINAFKRSIYPRLIFLQKSIHFYI